MTAPRSLILNDPWQAPTRHWQEDRGRLQLTEGRRPAGYEIFDTRNNTRRTEPLELVNQIRQRVDAWRAEDYPGITTVTRSLLTHWHDRTVRDHPFYFCQLEAIETLIWWVEGPEDHKQGIHVPGDGGPWERVCNKMATGAGKTMVIAMIITWQALNALSYPRRTKDFSRAVFVVAPGLTVKERLQVLHPGSAINVYDDFSLTPSDAMRQRLNQAEILVENWHTLMPLKEPERSVVKKGAESDRAFVKRVLGKLAEFRNLVIINDEAHHAYRVPEHTKTVKKQAAALNLDDEEATRWIEGLDRIHGERSIQRCFDLSATPFAPTGRTNTEQGLFGWIVSDFGLNDAIESGLVKTPRVVVRDGTIPNAKTLKPKLYHLYREAEVREDLNRRGAEPHEALPPLVQAAYNLLGADWRKAREEWEKAGHTSPPVLLTVCNRIETAARLEHWFNTGQAQWPELRAPERTLRVDSKVLEKAEIGEAATADKDYEATLRAILDAVAIPAERKERLTGLKKEELLREIVDSVGKRDRAGQDLQNVISVAMLSEGWDAKNVTHVMGLRAFTSQLLCEQVIGRGLRRVGYDTEEVTGEDGITRTLFVPEHVNVFGVPLSVFQDVDDTGEAPPPPKKATQIEARMDGKEYEISWPNVLRVDTVLKPVLTVDWGRMDPLPIDPAQVPLRTDIAPAIGGAADWDKITVIDLEKLPDEFRFQRLVFKAAEKALTETERTFTGTRTYLAGQLIRLMERFLESDRIQVASVYHREDLRRRILIALSLDRIAQHLVRFVNQESAERIELVFDEQQPIGSTGYSRTWYTTRPTRPTRKSQISDLIVDSAWEAYAADQFEMSDLVQAYAKNERLGFQIQYLWNGSRRRFIPDFLVRLTNGKTLVLEIKGLDSEQNKTKRDALDLWVRGVNAHGGFGVWCWDVAFEMAQVRDILAKHTE